jgi:hypothetical protein
MKYLCLAYSDDKKWNALSRTEQAPLQAYDQVLRSNGHFVAAVQSPTTLQFVNGTAQVHAGPLTGVNQELAGFYIIEAEDLNKVIQLLSKTPCAQAGSYELRKIEEITQT